MKDKIALVTGGTSGIGKAIVEALLKEGCQVVTCYHDDDTQKDDLKRKFPNENLEIIKCDVSDENQVINLMKTIREKYGHLNYLVNNAGTFLDNFIKDFSIEDFKKVLDVNLIGKVIVTKQAYSMLEENSSIVNIASHLGVIPCTESPAYCAAAAGIINFTKATALEYADKKIRTNSICPAFTPTPLSLKGWTKEEIQKKLDETPLNRLCTPEDTAKLCLFLLSDDSSFMTGENISLNGGRL
ncbi:MAG TPA: hypothetical protein DCY94_03495 [Firmicutes bacterium]|nr:hypothetical protein [Bacillota bacterium]